MLNGREADDRWNLRSVAAAPASAVSIAIQLQHHPHDGDRDQANDEADDIQHLSLPPPSRIGAKCRCEWENCAAT